jgi:ectoine hydroxylase-related dioxygenase (phytanoyl-CoA dioxygenase family)
MTRTGSHSPSLAITPAQRESWDRDGFIVLPAHFGDADLDRVDSEVERQWSESRVRPSALTVDVDLDSRGQRVKLHDAPLTSKDHPYKLNDLYLVSPVVRDVVLEPRLAMLLGVLLKGTPLVCNSLSFQFGSQQAFHTDSLYMKPLRKLNLVATWIALEDVHEDAGPLQYFPGSHRITPYRFSNGDLRAIPSEMPGYTEYMQRECRRLGLRPETFCARRGDCFIWHSQLFHGGSQIRDLSRTRRSLVTHYYRSEDKLLGKVRHNAYGHYWKRPHQAAGTYEAA